MIYNNKKLGEKANNKKIGKATISKIIEMGHGDIGVAAFPEKEKFVSVCFTQGKKGEIGRKIYNICEFSNNREIPDTMLIFKDEKSINVVIKRLKLAKFILRKQSKKSY
ncbi:hypothetical protein [Flavivirga jejuensis]|uniref:Uncharacterized protein n=1 Tax=Flavivirga jejuensis TaxID=870487 RepID=A0ABT8WQM6_9FLAO|nr:hypothetical protein [Flavivirga jejuensis]MDO5975478.1 hypothetical protein [Flavivirga jejuensis]